MIAVRDLFGEIPVSVREIELWLFKVPRMPHYSTRRAWYVRGWNVVEKIARSKLRGELAGVLGDETCEFCGQLLCQDQAELLPPVSPSGELERLRRRVLVLETVLRISAATNEKPPQGRRSTVPAVSCGA